jgi:tetrahydromethanopterin S-methyltransferase subunit A
MAIEKEFIDRFQQQIDLLKNLEKAIQDAIVRADGKIKKMRDGKSMEEVFGPAPPKQTPGGQDGGG